MGYAPDALSRDKQTLRSLMGQPRIYGGAYCQPESCHSRTFAWGQFRPPRERASCKEYALSACPSGSHADHTQSTKLAVNTLSIRQLHAAPLGFDSHRPLQPALVLPINSGELQKRTLRFRARARTSRDSSRPIRRRSSSLNSGQVVPRITGPARSHGGVDARLPPIGTRHDAPHEFVE